MGIGRLSAARMAVAVVINSLLSILSCSIILMPAKQLWHPVSAKALVVVVVGLEGCSWPNSLKSAAASSTLTYGCAREGLCCHSPASLSYT